MKTGNQGMNTLKSPEGDFNAIQGFVLSLPSGRFGE